jgi:hypothetical protein
VLDDLEARHVVAVADLLGQPEEAGEHRRHELDVGDPVALDEPQAPLGVEALHHHDRGPEPVGRERAEQRGRVVEGSREQEDLSRADSPLGLAHGDLHGGCGRVAHRRAGEGLADALGSAGGAGGVEHLPALLLVLHRAVRGCGEQVVVALEAGQAGAHGDADRYPRQVEPGDEVGHRRRSDHCRDPCVGEHVLHLGRQEMAVDGDVVEPGPVGAPGHLEVLAVVLHEDREVIPGAQVPRSQGVGEPAGAVLELGVGRHLPGATKDGGRGVGTRLGVHGGRQPLGHAWYSDTSGPRSTSLGGFASRGVPT